MTRIIKNKVVVPKDYNYVSRCPAYLFGELDRSNPFSSDIPTYEGNAAPFDMVYEVEHGFSELTEMVTGTPTIKDTVTYKIIFNIYDDLGASNNLRFIRFILRANINFTYKSPTSLIQRPTPCLNVECNHCFKQFVGVGESIKILATNNITIDLIQINDRQFKTNENGYSIIYDIVENEIYDDTENGTESWVGNAPVSEASGENVSVAAFDFDSNISGMPDSIDINKGAKINKAITPMDYADVIFDSNTVRSTSTNIVKYNLINQIDLTELPRYNMVGEINCEYRNVGYIGISAPNNNSYLPKIMGSEYKINTAIANRYRLIRIVEKPNLSVINEGSIDIAGGLIYKIILNIDGTTYEYPITLSLLLKPGESMDTGNRKYAFVFDTKTKEFDRDFNDVGLWSSYQTIMDNE